jgi:hypothetical protein
MKHWKRLLGVLAAVAALLTGGIVTATAAEATDMACNYDNTFNACVALDWNGYGWYRVYAGLDAHMSQQYAQAIVDCGTGFRATLWGLEDHWYGDSSVKITDLVLQPGWPAASATGLSFEFGLPNLYETALDTNSGDDSVWAAISYYDCNTGWTRTFTTGTLHGYY